jgi:hypothetical protein
MILGIKLPLLRNAEFIQFIKDVLGITKTNDPVALNVEPQCNNLQGCLTVLEDLFVTDQGSALTDTLVGLDGRRDKAITGIGLFVNAQTYYFDPAIAGHAQNLARQLTQYGTSIARENYQAETSIIDSIVTDFKTKPELVAAIDALQLKAWREELETANVAFNTTYLLRTQQLGSVSPDTILQKRAEANTAYYELRDFIDSYFTINKGAAPYSKATNELNALIEQYNVMMAGRLAKEKDTPAVPVV